MMPACVECERFDAEQNLCGVEKGSPGRKCVIALLEKRLKGLTGLRVCEIGPGPVSIAKDILETNGNTWLGVEPKGVDYKGQETIRTHEGTVTCLPFEDSSIDYVIATQSMEHWFEFGSTFRAGIREIHRVLKPGGTANINVPIHLHGHPIFVRGDLKRIRSLFYESHWQQVQMEEWRREHEPLDRWLGWHLGKIPDSSIPKSESASTWILEVILTRSSETRRPTFREELLPRWIDFKTILADRLQLHRIKRGLSRRFGSGQAH